MQQQVQNLKLAERGAIVSITAYVLLSGAKLAAGSLFHSDALTADAFNNISDIIGNIAVLVGLKMAQKPADTDHKFGHWKMEDLASLMTSFIMFVVGFQVLHSTLQKLINKEVAEIDIMAAIIGVVSAIVMLAVYLYNKNLAKRVRSKALEATAKDNLSDALTSIGTSIAVVAAAFQFPIVDKLAAIIITFFILKTAYSIFMESFFTLSDGFDEELLNKYETDILKLPKISAVKSQRGRTYGANIYLDVVLEMNPDLSVYESHEVTEKVEQLLILKHGVFDVDIHVEPSEIPHDEMYEHVFDKLYRFESEIQAHEKGYEQLIEDTYLLIDEQGQYLNKDQMLQTHHVQSTYLTNFQMVSVSQKSKLVTFEIGNKVHTSLWRRHEVWQVVFHQITEKKLN
ncbi:cation diffusion facilitator family transporter [Streptococcus sp. zg-86]|uniref:Cation diffusion facilitator family transporter n=1 Tax=Streptococcus zhangguiae TaxID=2664091 RepID=A0A6I4RDY1_9STRE|nr:MULTISPECIES: cation diffusion facilitator family transporter [unclassified Streptococcus]MTB64032.1 cation diffusion facilitator family transporter [Streptococcus sp. zg-86]MTB90342.1 cation diffusion facilitator family transporter [Streptococcus sp. zg-36]MWV56020.1 cation diffusion facilitator family transporter [Streptococcus sp. zg-70]QTH47058.1 cation transporter [Streptococcus sp. zg-86]